MKIYEKIKANRNEIILMAICLVFIFFYYVRNVFCINTVWELVDEFGYLANAAYLCGEEWATLTNCYYGYGYSLLLIPFFWIGAKGTTMIRGAILINALCISLAYVVQVNLIKKVCPKMNRYLVVIAGAILSFYPYLVASSMKVMSECLVYLMAWVCLWLFYKAIETKKHYWFIMLAIAMSYIFFVHTRTFVFIGAICLVLFMLLFLKKISWKNVILFVCFFALCFALGQMLKIQIIQNVYTLPIDTSVAVGIEQQSTAIQNTLNAKTIFAIIRNVFSSNLPMYICSFFCKYFYVFVATLGLYQLGAWNIICECVYALKNRMEIDVAIWVKILALLSSGLMILATAVNNPGRNDNVAYYFYGRYYEYILAPVVFIGMDYYSRKEMKLHTYVINAGVLAVAFLFSYQIYRQLESTQMLVDDARIASFVALCAYPIEYRYTILLYFIIALICFTMAYLFSRNKRLKLVMLFSVVMMFIWNNQTIVERITTINKECLLDNVVIERVLELSAGEKVYFLDANDVSSSTAAQALLGKKKLEVVDESKLKSESEEYFLARSSMRVDLEDERYDRILTGYYFDLYYVR